MRVPVDIIIMIQQYCQPIIRLINDWILCDTLGIGDHSKVKLGIHVKTRLKAALKIKVLDETCKISDSKKQLIRELSVMKKIKHENIIQLIEFDESAEYTEINGDQTKCFVCVLELASGGELFDFLMFIGHFDEAASRTYFHQIVSGLEAMHKVGFAQFDLKPQNLLLDENYVVKISDLGFALLTETKTQSMKTRGSCKGYLAPELFKRKNDTSKCIFALGRILFTMYAGFSPFEHVEETDWWWDKLRKGLLYIAVCEKLKSQKDKDKLIAAGNRKIALFWKAHERTRQFRKILKNLLERMLHPRPEHRYNIKHIKKHQWYLDTGAMYNQNELKKYLQQRVRTVLKQKVNKIKKHLVDQAVQHIDQCCKLTPIQKRTNELHAKNAFENYCGHVKDDLVINTCYQFVTFCSPAEIAARIERCAVQIRAETTISPHNNIILIRSIVTKQFIIDDATADEEVTFVTKQFIIDDQPLSNQKEIKRYLVSFKRLEGSHQSYRKVVEEFWASKEIMEAMQFDQ